MLGCHSARFVGRRVQEFMSDPRSFIKPYKETILAMGLEAKLYIAAIYLISTVFMLPLSVACRPQLPSLRKRCC